MLYIIMNLEEFLWNFVLYMFILAIILFIIARVLRKNKSESKTKNNDRIKTHTSISYGNNPIVHVKQEVIFECPVCGYISDNEDDFDDGACIMCDAI